MSVPFSANLRGVQAKRFRNVPCVHLYRGAYAVTLSILVGTAVGLLVKYVFDKRYIFRFKTQSVVHDAKIFALYVVMGLFTTVIFWGTEFGFYFYFKRKRWV